MAKHKDRGYPEIDLSLVTFNSARWIKDFFSSLIAQHYPVSKLNIFVRDNGSTDETLTLLKEVASSEGGFASFHLETGDNIGFGRGHNSNLKKGTAPFFLVSNLDLTYEPEAIAVVVGQALNDDMGVASWEFRQKPYEHPKYYNPVSLFTSWSSGACILFRREAIVRVGGYEPRIFMYGEDAELSFRLRSEGFMLKYCPTAVCWHYSYETAQKVKPLQFIESKLGVAYLRMRYGSWWQVLAVLPLFIATFLLPQKFPGQRKKMTQAIIRLFRNAPYFIVSRRRIIGRVPFERFDCGPSRLGAFYENRTLPPNPPLVSIVVRTYQGRLPFLREAVQSVMNQTYPNIELIVVEIGGEAAESYLREIANRGLFTSVRHIKLEQSSTTHAGNAGLAAASGEYLGFLDDDALIFADHVEVLIEEIVLRKHVDVIYGGAARINGKARPIMEMQQLESVIGNDPPQPFSRERLLETEFISPQSVLFRRTLYTKLGGFNEEFVHLGWWELWLRYSRERDFVFVPKLTSLYRKHGRPSKVARMEKKQIRNMYSATKATLPSLMNRM